MMDQPDFKHMDNNGTFITPADFDKVDELVDWLVDKKKSGYKMVNSASRLDEMRLFMRGNVQEWNCRRIQFPDRAHRRYARSVFPQVQRHLRLGNN
jgi:hypothetical protein